jgi:hypothetical protein
MIGVDDRSPLVQGLRAVSRNQISRSEVLDASLLVQTVLNVRGAISGQYFRNVSSVIAFQQFELLGAPLYRGLAVFRRNLVRVHQFLSKACLQRSRQENRDCKDLPDPSHRKNLLIGKISALISPRISIGWQRDRLCEPAHNRSKSSDLVALPAA